MAWNGYFSEMESKKELSNSPFFLSSIHSIFAALPICKRENSQHDQAKEHQNNQIPMAPIWNSRLYIPSIPNYFINPFCLA